MRRGTQLHFSLACLATVVAVLGSAADAVAACPNMIRVYYSRPGLPCPQNDEDGCAPSGCPYNERLFGYPWVDFQCPNHPGSALCDDPGNEFVEWVNANRPQGVPDRCENPWSGVFYSCDTLPEPNDCRDPRNGKDTLLGDPVDLATGELEQSAVDVDLGRGLAFRRHYASDRSATTTMGKGWQHNLDWKLDYQAEGSDAEIVLISRPLSSTAVFVRVSAAYDPETYWKSGLRGAGGLEGEAATGFTFTDDDGTRVTFDGESFDLESIRRPGEPTIAVDSVGNTSTFTNGSACLAVTKSASRVSSVVAYMNGGCTSGTADAAWTYSYDGNGCLRTVAGQSPADPGEPLTWTYTYPSTAGNCTTPNLTKVERTVGAGAAVTVGEWTFSGGIVSSAREPALTQDLCLGYDVESNNDLTTSVCAVPASGTCNVPPATACGPAASPAPLAIFTSNSGRLVSVEQVEGGPDVEVSFTGATFTPAGGAAPSGLWRTRTDPNGNVTWFDGYDPRGRPARIVEGWVDTNGNGAFNSGDGFARDREFTHHPRLGGELSVTETSVLNSAGIRVSVEDYDTDLDSTPNEDPTDLLHRQAVQGWTLDAGGSQEPFTDTTTYSYDAQGRLTVDRWPAYRAAHGDRLRPDRWRALRAAALREWRRIGLPPVDLLELRRARQSTGRHRSEPSRDGVQLRRPRPRPHREAALRRDWRHHRRLHVRRRWQPDARAISGRHRRRRRLPAPRLRRAEAGSTAIPRRLAGQRDRLHVREGPRHERGALHGLHEPREPRHQGRRRDFLLHRCRTSLPGVQSTLRQHGLLAVRPRPQGQPDERHRREREAGHAPLRRPRSPGDDQAGPRGDVRDATSTTTRSRM